VISITDGHIFLESDLFNKGIRPAINVGISVSRVGSSAQTKAMKKVAGKIRLELAQYRELEAFVQFASDLDEGTKKQIESGRRYTELLKQGQHEPMPFERQVVSIYAMNSGLFEDVPVFAIGKTEQSLHDFIEREHPDIFSSIAASRELSDETEAKLKEALAAFANLVLSAAPSA
jgi:F-type H+-transporting ATPase subunit alpha